MENKLSPTERTRAWRLAHPGYSAQYNRTYYKKHKRQIKRQVKDYYLAHKEKHRETHRMWKLRNKDQVIAAGRDYYKRNKNKQRETRLHKRYGVTPDEYKARMNAQKRKCVICARDGNTKGRFLCVDHDHKTGKVRGLLCTGCNIRLGWFEKHMIAINKYLDNHGA